MKNGALILIVGLPGSGKGTLIAYLREQFPQIVFPISWTTRPMRPGELEGAVYHFASEEEFTKAVQEGAFLEWVSIDTGHRYGTLREAIVKPLHDGKLVVREVEVQGARAIRTLLPEMHVVTIFIDSAGDWEDLAARMRARAPITEEELAKRKERYEGEIRFKSEAEYVVENAFDKLDEAKQQLKKIIAAIERE